MLTKLFAAAMLCAAFHATAAPAPGELQIALDAALAQGKVPAIGAVLMRDGQISEQAFGGVQRNDGAARVSGHDVWLIGSTGKVMTVALLARLVERGVLAWETPLAAMLPELAPRMHRAYRGVTLLQLLSHQAGLPRDLARRTLVERYFADQRALPAQRLAYIGAALREKPAARPGTFSYSNTGFLVAAAIAEKATGTSYEDLMHQEVFAPLAMHGAGFGNTGEGQNRGHQRGKPMLHMAKFDDGAPAMYAPAGFLHMPLADWARFNLDQLAGAKGQGKLLTQASYRLMQSAQPGSPAGLDWGVQASIAGRQGPVLVHQGSDGNWLAMAVLFPTTGHGMLVVANAAEDMGADAALMGLVGKFLPTLSPAAAKP